MKVVGVGAGGHAKVLIDIARHQEEIELVGLVDDKSSLYGSEIGGVRVLGSSEMLLTLFEQGVKHCFLGIGAVGDNRPRQIIFEKLKAIGFQVIKLVHPSTVVAEGVKVGEGVAMMAGVLVNAGAKIGTNVVLNTGCIVDHDCIIEDHVHIAPGAVLSGEVKICRGAHVGTGASIKQGITVGAGAVVGTGAAVVCDVAAGSVVAGVPARVLRKGQGA